MRLENFFNPKSVAIIGASSDKNKVGFALISNLTSGKERKIFPVSISEKEILGLKTFSSVKEIPEEIDLAVIAVRSDIVPQILEECGEKKIKNTIVISAGFREIGQAGKELEEKVSETAKKHGIALLGPNCLGTMDSHSELNASFAALKPLKGDIAFLSQSGALGTSVIDLAVKEGVGFSKFISLGNEAQLTEIEFLEFLEKDRDTKAILMYLEKLSNGPKFMKLCEKISKTKPIVVLKAGRSSRGIKAVMSHTGSLASDDAVFSAALKQSGVVAIESIREFFNMAKLFQLGILKPLQNLIILTNGGGPGVVAGDLVDLSRSLSLAEISDSTKEALKKVLPPMAAFGNPVDIVGDALSSRYSDALKILCAEKDVDGIILMLTPQMMTEVEAAAKLVLEFKNKKPIIPVFLGGPTIEESLTFLKQNGLVNFTFPKDAVEALDNLTLSAKKKAGLAGAAPAKPAETSPLQMMRFTDMSKILDDYKIPVTGILVKEKSEIQNAFSNLQKQHSHILKNVRMLFSLKAISPDIVHKTEMGAVKLNLETVEEAEKAWDEIVSKNPNAKLEGMLVQPTAKGKETIIGMKRDPVFGPTVLFGLGGIFTEALKDTSLRIAPVNKKEALEMISEIKGEKILSGLRGEKSVDFDSLADFIVKISKLSIDHPEIKEIDFNPVMATSDGTTVVDVRFMI